MLEGGGSPFLDRDARHVGPGHAAVFRHEGQDLLSYHFYDPESAGRPRLRIVSLYRRADGWPEAGAERLGGTAESN